MDPGPANDIRLSVPEGNRQRRFHCETLLGRTERASFATAETVKAQIVASFIRYLRPLPVPGTGGFPSLEDAKRFPLSHSYDDGPILIFAVKTNT